MILRQLSVNRHLSQFKASRQAKALSRWRREKKLAIKAIEESGKIHPVSSGCKSGGPAHTSAIPKTLAELPALNKAKRTEVVAAAAAKNTTKPKTCPAPSTSSSSSTSKASVPLTASSPHPPIAPPYVPVSASSLVTAAKETAEEDSRKARAWTWEAGDSW